MGSFRGISKRVWEPHLLRLWKPGHCFPCGQQGALLTAMGARDPARFIFSTHTHTHIHQHLTNILTLTRCIPLIQIRLLHLEEMATRHPSEEGRGEQP